MKIDVFCDICHHYFATTDSNTLSIPIDGSMFQSHMASRKVPPPFNPGQTWNNMKCPYCRHRPFILEGTVTISRSGKTFKAGDIIEKPKTQADLNQDIINSAFANDEAEGEIEAPEAAETVPEAIETTIDMDPPKKMTVYLKHVCPCGAAFQFPGQLKSHKRQCTWKKQQQ